MSWDTVDDWLAERVKHPEEIHRDSHNTVQHYLQLIQEELEELRDLKELCRKVKALEDLRVKVTKLKGD